MSSEPGGMQHISIHALREEGDRRFEQRRRNLQRFLSTPSARRATCCCHPAFEVHTISIHALREEGDLLTNTLPDNTGYFYPRPPRGGRRPG